MPITVVCPKCSARYQVDESLRGKKMRCPTASCRLVFDVVEVTGPTSKPPPAKPGNSANDTVPMLPSQPAVPAPAGPNFGDWRSVAGRGGSPAPAAPPAPVKPPPAPVKQAPPAKPPAPRPRPAATPAPTPVPTAVPTPAPADDLPTNVATADWHAAPPPVATPGQPRSSPAFNDTALNGPVPTTPEVSDTPTEEDEMEALRKAKSRRARKMMIGLVVGLLVVVGGGAAVFFGIIRKSENSLYERATEHYKNEEFDKAAGLFQELAKKFETSERIHEYRFMAGLASLRSHEIGKRIEEALDAVDKFLTNSGKTPEGKKLLEGHKNDLGKAFLERIQEFYGELNSPLAPEDGGIKLMARVERTMERLVLEGAVSKDDAGEVTKRFQQEKNKLETVKNRLAAIAELEKLAAISGIEAMRETLKFRDKQDPDFANDARVKTALDKMYAQHLAGVKFVDTPPEIPNGMERRVADSEPVIILDPQVQGRKPVRGKDETVVLALVRGVLYVLSPSTGETKWALRVGIDTSRLPILLEPTATNPSERLLVLSADSNTLTALDIDQRKLWEYKLGAPCLGRPLIINQRAFLPTYKGEVHEVELAGGKLLGRYLLGQKLTVGGVYQKMLFTGNEGGPEREAHLAIFAADDNCVYVLDVEKRKCETIMYTNHLAGTLRGEPLVLPEIDPNAAEQAVRRAYLVLTQVNGMDESELKLYSLPARERDAQAVAINPPPRLRGLTWFAPYSDSEKIVCISDASRLGLFGINQPNNRDNILFHMIPSDGDKNVGYDLSDLMLPKEDPNKRSKKVDPLRRGLAQVVHVMGEDIWVQAQGSLQRLEIRLNRKVGPQASARWNNPIDLGSPLHEAQMRGGMLYLVSQPLNRPVSLVTAVNPEGAEPNPGDEDRRIIWQRQLGMVCHGEPIVVGGEVLTVDQAGGFFRFDPKAFNVPARGGWLAGGQRLQMPLEFEESAPPLLLRPDERTLLAVTAPGGKKIVLRRYQAPGPGEKEPNITSQDLELKDARLAGNVVPLGQSLLVPLDNGSLKRYPLPLTTHALGEQGPTWRSRRAGPQGRCFIVALSDTEFLTTDGSRGVTRWQWPAGKPDFEVVAPQGGGVPPAVDPGERIVSVPLLLPKVQGAVQKAVIADSRGVLSLIGTERLDTVRKWELKGKITAGPFLRGNHVGCVVDNTRLVWLDPDSDKLWEYKTEGEGIVGQPQRIEEMVVVCDESGKFVGIDPATGKAFNRGYTLKAAVAPAATPVPFGAGRAFAPLSDGTIMLLSLERLR